MHKSQGSKLLASEGWWGLVPLASEGSNSIELEFIRVEFLITIQKSPKKKFHNTK